MNASLARKKVAILAASGFEQSELTRPQKALEASGASTYLVSPEPDQVKGWDQTDWGANFSVDVPLEQAKVEDFDALLLPGGERNPDHLRKNEQAVAFVRAFVESGKPIAAICHGPRTLIEADAVKGRRLTSNESISTDLQNAGAHWVDEPVVVDQGLVTSRKPDDILVFSRTMIEEFAKGPQQPAPAPLDAGPVLTGSGVK